MFPEIPNRERGLEVCAGARVRAWAARRIYDLQLTTYAPAKGSNLTSLRRRTRRSETPFPRPKAPIGQSAAVRSEFKLQNST